MAETESPKKPEPTTLERRRAALEKARAAASISRKARALDARNKREANAHEEKLISSLESDQAELEREQLEVSRLELALEKKRLAERRQELQRELEADSRPKLQDAERELVARCARDPDSVRELPAVKEHPGLAESARHAAVRNPDALRSFFL